MPPEGRDAALEIYIKQDRTDVERQLDNINMKHSHDYLSSYQRKALRELQQFSNIILKPANKVSAVMVLSKDNYIKEAEHQLNIHVHHIKLYADPTL